MNKPVLSILYPSDSSYSESESATSSDMPEYFHDLNLDQVTADIVGGFGFYELNEFYYHPLQDLSSINFRHQVFADLMNDNIFAVFNDFSVGIQRMRARIERSQKLHNLRQRHRWMLDAVEGYCTTVTELVQKSQGLNIRSSGLNKFVSFLNDYLRSEYFQTLSRNSHSLKEQISAIRYNLFISANRIVVTPHRGETDYGAEVEETFERFRHGTVNEYTVNFPNWPDMNPVEEKILEIVVNMQPLLFDEIQSFVASNINYADPTVVSVERELQFYISYLGYISKLDRAAVRFSFPELLKDTKCVEVRGLFDIALAQKVVGDGKSVVPNDLVLEPPKQLAVITGPNSGGKTTFARAFGQLSYLSKLGCPVPAKKATLPLFDQIFTHFEREENLDDLRGKLEDELVRIHKILDQATGHSLIIMNESFGDTTLEDSKLLGHAVLSQIIDLGAICICVTFVDELASIGDATLSLMSTVEPNDPTKRTYSIVVQDANGLAYALAIAEKYGLTYRRLKGSKFNES